MKNREIRAHTHGDVFNIEFIVFKTGERRNYYS